MSAAGSCLDSVLESEAPFWRLERKDPKTDAYRDILGILRIKEIVFRKYHFLKVGCSEENLSRSMTPCPLWKSVTENVCHGA